MHIGLIGGIGPAAQDYYLRQLIGMFADNGAALELTTAHADTPTLLANMTADRQIQQANLFVALADRLARAGADFVAVTSIAGHFCRREFAARSPLPVIDMIDAVAQDVALSGYERIGILGTRIVMETGFYGGIASATVVSPPGTVLADVHAAYVAMASASTVNSAQRAVFTTAAQAMIDDGADAIMLGGTDLVLAFDAATCEYPLIDCAAIHARAIARYAMGEAELMRTCA
jgi:aspartate racemase